MSEGRQTRSPGDADGRERNGKEAGRIPSGRLAQKPKKRGPPAPPKKCVKKPSLVTVVFPQVDLQGQKDLLLTLWGFLRPALDGEVRRGVFLPKSPK